MKIINKKYIHSSNNEAIYTCLNNEKKYNLFIVYFINCLTNVNYFDWLFNQINMVKNFNGTIYIIATIGKEEELIFRDKVSKYFPGIIIECNYSNDFEYPGILKVWELGQIHNSENDIFLYFHSKGTTHHKNYENNNIKIIIIKPPNSMIQ